ncbi:MAG: sugar phosphate isomerase/epimerase [Actinomycetia bacterium]|nr:sugar phosphate isomerase/epimerase [Actinomycetes bacterium]
MFNLTTDPCDLDRFSGRAELLAMMQGFDGVELLSFEPDRDGVIPVERIIGLHMCYYPYWLDFYCGDRQAWLREFGSTENCISYYGSDSPAVILDRFRQDLAYAHQYGAEYVVFHVSDASIEEAFTRNYRHSDAEVIDAACEILNSVFADEDGSIALLMENLWLPGLTLTDPDMTRRLLDGIDYPNKGIMLDTGHLLHTNTSLRTQSDAVAYIHRMLDRHAELVGEIRGVHLNQSLTGIYAESMRSSAPGYDLPYAERSLQSLRHAQNVDKHEPFVCPELLDLLRRIAPDYLTYEFISTDLEDLRNKLAAQRAALSALYAE